MKLISSSTVQVLILCLVVPVLTRKNTTVPHAFVQFRCSGAHLVGQTRCTGLVVDTEQHSPARKPQDSGADNLCY